MALISVYTVIRAISLFHLTAAYLFLTAPKMITDQNVVFVLGESLRLVRIARQMYHERSLTSLCSHT